MNPAKTISSFLQIIFLYYILYMMMCVVYVDFIIPKFGTEWLILHYDFNKVIISILVIIFLSLILSFRIEGIKNIFLHLQFVLPVLPMLVIYAFGGGSHLYIIYTISSFLLIYFVVVTPPLTRKKDTRTILFYEKLSIKGVMFVSLFLSFLTVFLTFLFVDKSAINFDINKVYDYRRQAADNIPTILGYMLTNLTAGILPIGVAAAIYLKKYSAIVLFFIIGILLFGLTSHKVPLFITPVIVAIYYFFQQKFILKMLLIAQIVALVLSLYSPLLGDTESRFGTYSVRRNYFVPAHANYLYFDFFANREKTKWSHSKLSFGLIQKPYKYPSARIIGTEYSNVVDWSKRIDRYNNINTGWLGVGYGHLGFIGMLIYALIIGLTIRFSGYLANKTNQAFVGSALFIPYFVLFASSDVPTVFLSHGLIILMLFGFFIKPLQR